MASEQSPRPFHTLLIPSSAAETSTGAPRAREAPDEVLPSLSRTHGIKEILLRLKVKTAARVSRWAIWKVLLRDEKRDFMKKVILDRSNKTGILQ